ncbi:hypothetical protein FOL47_002963, partial [Perkinsus chesapeaki]
DLGVTASLLAVDYFAWSKQTDKAKTLLRTAEGLVNLNANRPRYISSLLKAYQACVDSADYLTAYGHFYRSWETSPDQDDLFPLKRAHVMALKCGRSDLIYDAISKLYEMHNNQFPIPYMAGMVSFGLEQIGDYTGAERVAREGYDGCDGVTDDDIWLDHALAHSLYFQGKDRQKDAIEFFEKYHQSWETRRDMLHPFIYTHCFWHWALVLVETGDLRGALRIFDTNLWWKGREASEGMFTADNLMDEQVLVNALGLLWKLQSRQADDVSPIDLKPRWKSVASVARAAPSWLAHVDSLLDILLIRGLIEADFLEDASVLVGSIKAEKSEVMFKVAEAVYGCCLSNMLTVIRYNFGDLPVRLSRTA